VLRRESQYQKNSRTSKPGGQQSDSDDEAIGCHYCVESQAGGGRKMGRAAGCSGIEKSG